MSDLLFIPFQNYIKSLCVLHTDILHVDHVKTGFVRMQSGQDLQSIPQNASAMIVVVSNFIGRAIGENDTQRLRQNASILFLKNANANTGDPYQEIQDAQDKAMQVMFDFLSRMVFDFDQDDCGPLKYARTELMTFQPVDGPVLEAHYGWEMTIPFDAFAPAYNPVKWTDTP